jgi:hypothetical protein
VDLGGHPTGTWAPIFVRAWDGERHGEPALVQVRVVNQADLALGPGDVEVVRRPIQTDLGDVPNVAAHRRTVRVTVHNDGFVPSGAGVLVLSVETPGVGGALASTRVFADPEVPSIAPGGSLVVEADWDTLGHAGDMRIHAQVIHWDGASERRLDNNRVWTGTFVLVGGLGAGV